MATKWISPTWRMPEESNQSKFDNYSLNFNGSDNRIQIPYTELNGSTNCTISFWAKINYAADSEAKYPLHLTSGTNNPILWVFNANGIALDVYIGTVNFRLDGSFNRDIAEWNHWVLRFDGTGSSGNRTFVYQNGQQLTNQTGWAGATSIATASHLILGGRNLNATQWYYQFPGDILDVSIFDYTLTEQQITSLYNSNTPINPMAITPPPITYYPLGSSTGSASTLTIPNESVPSATVFDFNGSDKINTKTLTEFGISNEFTISTWIKPSSLTNYGLVLVATSGSGWTDGMGIYYLSNKWHFFVDNYSSGDVISTTTATTGIWYHIVGTFSSSGTVKLYINGVEEGTPVTGITLDGLSETLVLGSGNVDGEYSNTQIWNKELISSEVTTIYNNGVPFTGTQPQAANLKAWYKMNVDTSTWDGSNWIIGEAQANYSSALNFDGVDDVIPIRTMASMFGVLDDFTYSCWIRTAVAGVYGQYEVTFGGYSNGGAAFDPGKLSTPYGTTDLTFPVAGATKLNDGVWHHVATTFNDSTKEVNYYLDGQLDASTTWPAYITHCAITIGAGNAASTYNFTGNISNCVLHDSELTQAQVETLYNNGTPQLSPSFSPYGWWKCDNLTTGIEDSAGSNNGTNNGGTTAIDIEVSNLNSLSNGMTTANLVNSDLTRSIPYSSYSMVFDGLDDYISFPADASLNISTANHSMSFWLKTTDSGICVVSQKSGTELAVWIQSSKIKWAAENPFSSTSNINDGTWKHICFVADGSSSYIYINGVLDATGGSQIRAAASGSAFAIGSRPGSFPYEGSISNWSLFNKALTEDQVLTIYNGGVPNDISSLSPVSWWSLAGDSYFNGNDWICPDLGSASNNGTSNGMGGTELVGNGPGSTANGIATSMDIPANLKGNAPNSSKNAFSINMNSADRVEDVPA